MCAGCSGVCGAMPADGGCIAHVVLRALVAVVRVVWFASCT
jgi:hypothetical protein